MSATTLNAGAVVVDNGTISLGAASVLAGPTISGTGLFRLNSTSSVTANTTIDTTTSIGTASARAPLHTINDGVVFTINSSIWDPDDAGDVDDPINLGGNGAQILVNNVPTWTMTRTLTANTSALGIATIGGDSRVDLQREHRHFERQRPDRYRRTNHLWNPFDVNIAAGAFVRLNGGNAATTFNLMAGGTVNGPGPLTAAANRVLQGFGTINAPIDFDGTAELSADDGTLNVTGSIIDVGTIGTADTDGILNVVNAWNTSVADNVVLKGGDATGRRDHRGQRLTASPVTARCRQR